METPVMPRFNKTTHACESPHVVILGAGASLAALPEGDRNGKKLPLMDNLVEIVGLNELLKKNGIPLRSNFEELYDEISSNPKHKSLVDEIENKIYAYFSKLLLPNMPTIYDYLLLSLKEHDLIATFNWDPLIVEAIRRNQNSAKLPRIAFLHGNVSIGICNDDKSMGLKHQKCMICNNQFEPCKLLYPIKRKDYVSDDYISGEWELLKRKLQEAYYITIFGYSAPTMDVEAMDLMNSAFKDNKSRELSEVEIIDIKDESEIEETWESFLYSNHYSIRNHIFDSYLFNFPRRSCEAFAATTLFCAPWENNPFPKFKSIGQLHDWIKPLVDEENSNRILSSNPKN